MTNAFDVDPRSARMRAVHMLRPCFAGSRPAVRRGVLALLTVIFLAFGPDGAAHASELDRLLIEKPDGRSIPFRVEIVDTPASRARGLMFRKRIAPDYGMLFHFQKLGPASFWMKNTLIPLDMIFAGPTGRILRIHHQAQPGDLTMRGTTKQVRGVLEIRGGLARSLQIREGDYLRHEIFTQSKFTE